MTTMHPQHNAGAFLDRAEEVGSLMPKARRLLRLRQALAPLLPESLSRYCTVANARQGRVVLFAESSAVAAKLKLLAPTLRNRLLQTGEEVTSVVIEVQPPAAREGAQPHKSVLTARAAEELRALAERMPESRLKAALTTLAGRARPER